MSNPFDPPILNHHNLTPNHRFLISKSSNLTLDIEYTSFVLQSLSLDIEYITFAFQFNYSKLIFPSRYPKSQTSFLVTQPKSNTSLRTRCQSTLPESTINTQVLPKSTPKNHQSTPINPFVPVDNRYQ